jgi:hypothetical protein
MAFVGQPFRHDIFVSYSHGDVLGDGQSLLKQWSQGFVRELELELQAFAELGEHIKVFHDQSPRPGQGVDPMAPLTESLKNDVAAAAILAVLMTPHYLRSQWCRQEREWWIEAQHGLDVPHQKRVAIARVWPTEETSWPKDFLDAGSHQLLGCTFFDKSKADVRPQPYSWPTVDKYSGPFRDALVELVGHIRLRLLELKRELDRRRALEAERARLTAPKGQVLYLHGRDVHAPIWEQVHGELENDGFTVFPVEPERVESDPRKIRKIRNERIEIMSGCDAVLLLGTDDLPALQADLTVIGRFDRHQAIARSSRSLPCGVVDTVGVVRQKPAWSRKARKLDVGWFDASVPPWTPQIQAWLNGVAP